MAVRTLEEIKSLLTAQLGDDTSDTAIELVQDVVDTVSQANPDRILELERQNAELDQTWRKRYRDAFLHGTDEGMDDLDPDPQPVKSFSDLFTTGGK